MNRENLKRLLAPRHLAFIGGRGMARALKRCAEGGFAGQLWLVNPQHAELEGVPCVASVADLPCWKTSCSRRARCSARAA
ncbi:hypothetical protein K3001_29695, partial [Pseudomonas aeruginosa]|nr:hypothetical protein [Pseudomonas aeruginosa]